MYQHVVHRISFQHLEAMFEDCFGLRVGFQEIHMLKSLMASRYRAACKRILARIVGGGLIHADETHVNLKKGKGYVWVLTNLEDVHVHVQAQPGGGLPPGSAEGLQGGARHPTSTPATTRCPASNRSASSISSGTSTTT